MTTLEAKKIMVLGGYGRAGGEIVKLLAQLKVGEIHIGGRTLSKAQEFASELITTFPDIYFNAIQIEGTDKQKLSQAIFKVDLIIVAIPLNYENASAIIEGVLNSPKTHYIDLSPSREKHHAFSDKMERIEKANQVFILDAGFEPGLPSFMARCLISQSGEAGRLQLAAIYRDTLIPEGGIKDILNHSEPAKIWRLGKWKDASIFQAKRIRFSHGFGKALAIPITTPEIQNLVEMHSLDSLSYYHAGINGTANAVMLAWQTIFRFMLPIRFGISWFKWAIKKFTPSPYGGNIIVKLSNSSGRNEMVVSHNQLYVATAIPVVATAKRLLQNTPDKGGCFFMGEWVEKKSFIQQMEALGLMVYRQKPA